MISIQSLFKPHNKKELLVCSTDGFSLQGVVLKRAGQEFVTLYEAKTEHTDMAEALADIKVQLSEHGWQGGHAILLSSAVLSSLVELPVNPKKPRSLKQMSELVRWEIEPLLMQHTTRWSVGQLLVGQGYISDEQAEAIMDLQQGKPNAAGGVELVEKFSFKRFGELAVELGYIRNSQLNACLAGQEWLKADDEQIECGWSGQGEVPDVPGMYYWLVSAVGKSLLKRWVGLFKQQGIQLDGLYPLTGMINNLIDEEETETTTLEVHNHFAFLTHTKNNRIEQQAIEYASKHNLVNSCIDICHHQATAPIRVANCSSQHPEIIDVLTEHIDIGLEPFPLQSNKIPLHLLAAGEHAVGLGNQKLVAMIREGGPLPPQLERVEVRAGILACSLLLIIVVAEAYLFITGAAVKSHKAEIDAQWQVVDEASRALKARIAEVEKRKSILELQQTEHVRSEAMLNFYTQELPERKALVKNLLGIFQQHTPSDVIIESLDELGKRVPLYPNTNKTVNNAELLEVENFNLTAWALSEASAQSFIQAMTDACSQIGLSVRDPIVKEGEGPLGLNGFVVALRLVKLMPKETSQW